MKLFRNILPALLFLVIATGAMAQKIGYTNVELILAFMPETKNIEATLTAYGKKLEQSIATKEAYYQTKVQEYYDGKEANSMTPEKEKSLIQEIQKLEQDIQTSYQEAEDKVMQRQMELMQPLMEKMQKAIDEIAQTEKYTYVLNQTSGSNILYGMEQHDLTDKIAAKLGVTIPKE